MSNSLNIFQEVDLSGIEGAGFNTATDSLVMLRDELTLIEGAGFVTGADALTIIKDRTNSINDKVFYLEYTGNDVHAQVENAGVLNDISVAQVTAIAAVIEADIAALNDLSAANVNTEVDSALNTAIPGSPTVGSMNEQVAKIEHWASLHTMTYALSDTVIHSNDLEAMENITVYEKVKEILCPITGTIRIKFDIRCNTGGASARGKIYKNGLAHGAEQTNATTGYITYSEDLAFVQGDTIELWVVEPVGDHDIWYRNLRVCGNLQRYFENTME